MLNQLKYCSKNNMRIIHYTFGFYPMRSGGLTKYAADLMTAEKSLGHNVTAVIPGNFKFFRKKSKIIPLKIINGINIFRLENALPIPLSFGMKETKYFTEPKYIEGLDEWIENIAPDVLHIHTLMGLPIEFIECFKRHGVRVVMTTHDYFGLCPKVNYINNKGAYCGKASPERCEECCMSSKGAWYLKTRNSPLLLLYKRLFR